jgi:DNA-binding MarR family transcriptional regulator
VLIAQVRRVGRLLAAREEAALAPLGLGRSQVQQLAEVAAAPGLSASELARRVGLTAQSVAASVVALEGQGWLRRVPHPVHRRLVELSLTPAGRRVLVRAERALEGASASALSGLSAAKRKALAGLLVAWQAKLEA